MAAATNNYNKHLDSQVEAMEMRQTKMTNKTVVVITLMVEKKHQLLENQNFGTMTAGFLQLHQLHHHLTHHQKTPQP